LELSSVVFDVVGCELKKLRAHITPGFMGVAPRVNGVEMNHLDVIIYDNNSK
jgi:hypothetical protein